MDHRKKSPGRNEPPEKSGVKDHEPTLEAGMRVHESIPGDHIGPEGSLGTLRLCAVRANQNLGPRPCDTREFNQPPYAANEDLWVTMSGGWMVRIPSSLRSRLFHPVHRSCPVQPQDLEARRVTVMWYSGPREWERVVQEDVWQNGQVPPAAPVSGTWRG